MTGTLTIRDETLGGEPLHDWVLTVTTERMTVRELIRSRVYQEVQDHNLKVIDESNQRLQQPSVGQRAALREIARSHTATIYPMLHHIS